MAKTGKTVATLLIGAAIGAAVGYILATDKETRRENSGQDQGQTGQPEEQIPGAD